MTGPLILITLLCFVTLAASIGDQVKHYMINEANLIETASGGLAMNSPLLLQNNIKTVSVNDDSVVIIRPNCQSSVMSKQALGSMSNLLVSTRDQLRSAGTQNTPAGTRSGVATYSLQNQGSAMMTSGLNMNFESYNSNGWSMTKSGDNIVSVRNPEWQNNLGVNRVFLLNDMVGFVYELGGVQLKPSACLQGQELQLAQQVRAEVENARNQMGLNMRNMQQNMQNMQQNINRNMQNMQNHMRNMFGGTGGFNAFNRFPQQQQTFGNTMSQLQMPGQQGQMMQNGAFAQAAAGGYPGAQQLYPYGSGTGSFAANNFASAYGSNQYPFWPGFPY